MTFVFYILGALSSGFGALELYQFITLQASTLPSGEPYDTSFHSKMASQFFAFGLALLGAGAVLQRLDRIVHYSRITALAAKEAAGK